MESPPIKQDDDQQINVVSQNTLDSSAPKQIQFDNLGPDRIESKNYSKFKRSKLDDSDNEDDDMIDQPKETFFKDNTDREVDD